MKKLIIFFMGLLMCSLLYAQENELSIGAQLRARAEYRDGAFNPKTEDSDPAAFINNRSRISMDYKRDKLSLGFSAQQVGVWGQYPQSDKTNGRTMINESWANLNLGDGFFMKLGRQSLAYDDERILGGLDWHVAGRFHDALKMGFEDNQNKLHAIFAFNQNDEFTNSNFFNQATGQPYKSMATLWYQHSASKKFNLSFLVMNLGFQAGNAMESSMKYMQTLGTNLTLEPVKGLQLLGTFYYQAGETNAIADNQSISAFMWALNASYAVNPDFKIMAASDYLSGNDGNDVNKYKAFNPLYGTHHKFYGTMDYFYPAVFAPGLWDKQLGLSYKTSPKVTLALNYHHFSTNTDRFVGENRLSRTLGSEFDFQVTWAVMKDVGFVGGYSTMFGNDTMKAIKGGDPSKFQSWAWVSLNINPKVLITKW